MKGRIATFLMFRRDGQATLVALALLLAATMLRIVTLWEGPILDPLEAREFQLARILVEEGVEAWIASLAPADMPAIGSSPLVAAAGMLMGFEEVGWLRLPGFFVLILATFRVFSLGVRLTHRLDPGVVMAAVFFCAPATGLVMLGSTADALALLVFVTILGAAAQILRLRGDSCVPGAGMDPSERMNRLVVLPDTSEQSDARAGRRLWVAIGLGAWVAGAAPLVLAVLAILLPGLILWSDRVAARRGEPLLQIHPLRPDWYLGTLRPELALVAMALAMLPQAMIFASGTGWTVGHLGALLLPRLELMRVGAAPLGWWETVVLAGAGLVLVAPFFLASRRQGASALETLMLLMVVAPAPLFLLTAGWPLATLLILLTAALAAGFMVNLHIERFARGASDVYGLFGHGEIWVLTVFGFAALFLTALWRLYEACCAAPFELNNATYMVAVLLGMVLLVPVLFYTLVDRMLPALIFTALGLGVALELVAARMVLPHAGKLWPDWRLEAALEPWRSCGARVIADETGFSPGLRHHAGSGARMIAAGRGDADAEILIRSDADGFPGPGWRLLGWIGYVTPDGEPARAHLFGTSPRDMPQALQVVWRRCLRRLPPEAPALPPVQPARD